MSGIQVCKLQTDRYGSKSTPTAGEEYLGRTGRFDWLQSVYKRWDCEESWPGCWLQSSGVWILFWRQWRTTEGFWAEGQPSTVLQREQPGVRTGWMEMERDWLGNGVEFWGEAVVWSFPSYCPKARTIDFISLGQFPPIKSKGLGQVVLFSSGLV